MVERSPFPSLARVPDRELLVTIKGLVQGERRATSQLVAHLAELDQRRLYLEEGCSSLFTYCTQVLHLSEHAAYIRIEAARAVRKFPWILELLEHGDVHLAAVRLLAPHLTHENHRELLARARHKSKREVEELVAHVRPSPPVPTTIRKLPVAPATGHPGTSGASESEVRPAATPDAGAGPNTLPVDGGATTGGQAPGGSAMPELVTATRSSLPVPPGEAHAVVAPLAPDRYRVQFTATGAMYEKLCRARDLMRHRIPDGDPVAVIDAALTVLLKQLEKSKLAATDRPRAGRGTIPRSRYIPAAVRRAVWRRDGGRCAFVSRKGRRCRETGFLEFHHVDPHGGGGKPMENNIELRCKAHNRYESDLYFGPYIPAPKNARDGSQVRERAAPYAARGRRSRDGPIQTATAEQCGRRSTR